MYLTKSNVSRFYCLSSFYRMLFYWPALKKWQSNFIVYPIKMFYSKSHQNVPSVGISYGTSLLLLLLFSIMSVSTVLTVSWTSSSTTNISSFNENSTEIMVVLLEMFALSSLSHCIPPQSFVHPKFQNRPVQWFATLVRIQIRGLIIGKLNLLQRSLPENSISKLSQCCRHRTSQCLKSCSTRIYKWPIVEIV